MPTEAPPLIDQFRAALRARDVERTKVLLATHPEVRAAINDPIGAFGGRPIGMVKKDLPMVDLLLEYGADLNLKSDWAAGPFGILEWDITPAEAAPLIARGAGVDIFAAAHLGMGDRVRELLDADPTLISARGGDGRTALHCASTIESAQLLLDRGAAIDAVDIDHESTPAQYLIREAPGVARLLVDRGAWFDIYIAVGLRDQRLLEHALRNDPQALDHRAGLGQYTARHQGAPVTRTDTGDHRGDIYRWVFNHYASAIDAARMLGFDDMVTALLAHATPPQRLLAACAAGDRAVAEALVQGHPGLVASLRPDQMRLLADRAYANDTAAVRLMLDLGFDPRARGADEFEALRWAVFLGNADMTRALLDHDPPLNVPDRTYGGTPLGNCLYGALHGWAARRGDFVATVQLLIDAGEQVRPGFVPTGNEALDALLRPHL